MLVEYIGTNYAGFQKQPKAKTIQGVLEDTISTILRQDVTTIGAGRTDAGVHAYGQTVNFRTSAEIPNLSKFQWSLNCVLPPDISVKKIKGVPVTFNARRDAISREYVYQVLNRQNRSAFLSGISLFYPWKLNLKDMKKAAQHFISTHDFSAFYHKEAGVKVRAKKTIHTLTVSKKDDMITVFVNADSFLHNMVRIIVGTLLAVGAGKIDPADIPGIIESRERSKAGDTAPAHGLILKSVNYPDEL